MELSESQKRAVGQRLARARKAAGVNQKKIAAELKVQQSVVSDWENGKLQSWRDYTPGLARLFKIDEARLLELADGAPPDNESDDDEAPRDASADLPAIVTVPEYDVRLSAGGGFYVDRETTRRMWTLPRWLVIDQLGLTPDRVTIQEIVGDSMSPTLLTGDFALIDLRDQRIGLPGIFAVWDGDALVCKRLERIPASEPSRVRIRSDNPLHGEYEVLEEQVQVVGRVRWFTRRM